MTLPCETLSPGFTATDAIVPAADAGTSIDAFSLSSTASGASLTIVCPGWTSTSTTGTSLKSPMSGTTRSIVVPPPLPLESGGAGAGEAAGFALLAAVVPPFAAIVSRTVPCETLSPTRTLTSLTVPDAVDGTSIDALSLSRTTSGASLVIVCPGLTSTSTTGTSLKSPMSGTLTSIVWLTARFSHGDGVGLVWIDGVLLQRFAYGRRRHAAVVR